MKERDDFYDAGEIVGDDISGSGINDAVPRFWHQLTGRAEDLVAKGHGIIVIIQDRSNNEHELKPDEVETVESDEEVEGGYSIIKRNGAKVAVIGAVILGAGAGIAVYKKKRRQD